MYQMQKVNLIDNNHHQSPVQSGEFVKPSRAYSGGDFYLKDYMPEAKKIMQDKLDEYLDDLVIAEKLERSFSDMIYLNARKADETLYWLLFYKHIWHPLVDGKEKQIKRLRSMLNTKKAGGDFGEAEILRAKEYPIDELIDFVHGNAKCIFHNEATGSMHYYPKSNRVHCFGACGKSFDAIDVYQCLNGCDFISAVKSLI